MFHRDQMGCGLKRKPELLCLWWCDSNSIL